MRRTLRKSILLLFLAAPAAEAQELVGPHGYLTFEAEISDRDSVGRRGTFDLHHFNLFGNYLLNAKARVFGEIEFEHGADTEHNTNGTEHAGLIRIERAWFEYAFSRKFKVRVGKFLTPYGIYNEIHDAAPAYDTSRLPASVYDEHINSYGQTQRFYAKFATGIQVLGSLDVLSSTLKYQFLLSNGRGDAPFERDDNANKAIGIRLLADHPSSGLKFGVSLYTERNGFVRDDRQTSLAADMRMERRNFRLSAEFAHSILDRPANSLASGNQVANAGYLEFSYYLFKIQTLLVRYDLFDPQRAVSDDGERDLTFGTSIKIFNQALLKVETHFIHESLFANTNYLLAIASVAVVF